MELADIMEISFQAVSEICGAVPLLKSKSEI